MNQKDRATYKRWGFSDETIERVIRDKELEQQQFEYDKKMRRKIVIEASFVGGLVGAIGTHLLIWIFG